MTHAIPPESEITALAGYQFPGGEYRVEHWENYLLTECTGAELLPDGQVHPVVLFHLPILGCGTSIAQMFALGQAESDLSIMIESYDWEMFHPILEQTRYSISGCVLSAERCGAPTGSIYDRVQFCFEVRNRDTLTARTTLTWHFTRNTL